MSICKEPGCGLRVEHTMASGKVALDARPVYLDLDGIEGRVIGYAVDGKWAGTPVPKGSPGRVIEVRLPHRHRAEWEADRLERLAERHANAMHGVD